SAASRRSKRRQERHLPARMGRSARFGRRLSDHGADIGRSRWSVDDWGSGAPVGRCRTRCASARRGVRLRRQDLPRYLEREILRTAMRAAPTLTLILLAACANNLPEQPPSLRCDHGRAPPCARGYVCDRERDVCVPSEALGNMGGNGSAGGDDGQSAAGAGAVPSDGDASSVGSGGTVGAGTSTGACSETCSAPVHASASCVDGVCRVSCDPGYERCGNACVNTRTNPDHCGDCHVSCAPGEVCSKGECASDCPTGMQLCHGACVDLESDPDHCGSCELACIAPVNGSVACREGACSISCPAGLQNCSNACVDTEQDAAHCGNCGVVCPMGQVCKGG